MKYYNHSRPPVREDVPLYFLEEYPVFLEFMDVFFDWLYNQQGFTEAELQSYLDNMTDWVDPFSTKSPLEQLVEIKTRLSPGAEAKNFLEDHFLHRKFEELLSKNETILDKDGKPLFASYNHTNNIDAKYDDFGFEKTIDRAFMEFGEFRTKDQEDFVTSENNDILFVSIDVEKRRTLDHIRWLKLLKTIYRIRGTKKSFELFFWMYFGLPIQIKEPKNEIAGLDGNFDLDGTVGLRDDYYYDEYSYVIQLPVDDISDYQDVFNRIFKKYFHPAGFTVFLESSRG